MADLNKFESYAGGTGVYYEVEVDARYGGINVVSPDFDLSSGTVTVEYQLRIVDSNDTWITLSVPTEAANHLIIDDAGIKRIRIENTDDASGPYDLATFQNTSGLRYS